MAIKLMFDPALIDRAREVSGERARKPAVMHALDELIAHRRQRGQLELMDALEWDPGLVHALAHQRGEAPARAGCRA